MAYLYQSALVGIVPTNNLKKTVLRDVFDLMPTRVHTFYDVVGSEGIASINALRFSQNVVYNAPNGDVFNYINDITHEKITAVEGVGKKIFDVTKRSFKRIQTCNVSPFDKSLYDNLRSDDFVFCYSVGNGDSFNKAALGTMGKVASKCAFGVVVSAGRDGVQKNFVLDWCSSHECKLVRVGFISVFSRGKNIDDIVYITNVK